MLLSQKKWNFQTTEQNNHNFIHDVSPVVQDLLMQRGIVTDEQAREFLSPELTHLLKPDQLQQIGQACTRIHKAVELQEPILVYGDYDADGVSSTTLLLQTLQELGANCDYYIPNRFTEGYGPNEAAFRQAHANGCRLIITVDNGIAAVKEAEVAKELGVDLIITDHHEPQDVLPDAFAIIHPKCSPAYAFKELAGVGVAFKLAEQLLGYFPESFLDLVALGTIADLVPLVDENRILATFGLRQLTHTARPGLKALIKLCKISGEVTEEDVGFLIGPRLNAVGRLQDADLAVQLLASSDKDEADALAQEVQTLNQERQQIVADIATEAEEMHQQSEDDGVVIVAKEGWNEGVLGIVASRLVRKYDRPAIVLSIRPEDGQAKGSARSIPAFDLFKNCMQVQNLFTHFGGHHQAAGMTLPTEHISKLKEALDKSIQQNLTMDDLKQEITINQTLKPSAVTLSLIEDINKLAPFGMGNPKPYFHIKQVPAEYRQIGQKQNHLKMLFKDDAGQLDSIGFGFGHLYKNITPQTDVSVAGQLEINEWNGNRKPQMKLEDIRIDEWQLFDYRGKKMAEAAFQVPVADQDIVISQNTVSYGPRDLQRCTYDEAVIREQPIRYLYLLDLPEELDQLSRLIKARQPDRIYVCFEIETSAYMQAFPSREDFKWFYKQMLTHKSINLKQEIRLLMQAKGWTKDRIIFIAKVFFDLGFVTMNNETMLVNPHPVKRDLQDSKTYQHRLKQTEIEKTLYYSSYQDLKEWFSRWLNGYRDVRKEETNHGL